MASGLALLGFRCTGCGNCCKDLRVPLTAADLRRVLEATGSEASEVIEWLLPDAVDMTGEPGSFVWLERGRRALMTLAQRDAACRFLGENARCTVYDARPASCRLYPFTASFGGRGGLSRLRLLSGTECESARDGHTDPHALRVADELRWSEHAQYLKQVEHWNRSQRQRARMGHGQHGEREFLRFLGFFSKNGAGSLRK